MTTVPPPPEGGADPHRDNWVPVPLLSKNYDRKAKTYAIEFKAPKQLLLNEQYSAMVHDELLRNADRDGLIIEGQIMVTERDDKPENHEPDPTLERDAKTREVLLDPKKEEEVAAEQDAIESPYQMSKAEQDYRRRMRQNLRDTAEQVYGVFADKEIQVGEHKGRVNREAFMEGFYGGPLVQPPKREMMIVRAEAMVAMDMGVLADDSVRAEHAAEDDIEAQVADVEIPDDLSGLDE